MSDDDLLEALFIEKPQFSATVAANESTSSGKVSRVTSKTLAEEM